jgi:hypothetical protein
MRAELPPPQKLELDLVEERVLTERAHPYRYQLSDGSILDLSAFRETGIAVTYLPAPDGNHLFLDFVIVE